ncbi:hypothetical protein [Pedosphaera parvula]|uniref:Uncharacterized protein n=1 Tax=Pedosphaera parvula (strain Ellin514) TaxID=320771 RepID=B9XG64_PEDPL|nr:hypothetical protein [Pedosphaera parvula]EEF61226.1 hypothetical protein Cflav_PD3943 [Pedosphaera parvula Ellin514]
MTTPLVPALVEPDVSVVVVAVELAPIPLVVSEPEGGAPECEDLQPNIPNASNIIIAVIFIFLYLLVDEKSALSGIEAIGRMPDGHLRLGEFHFGCV